MKIALLGDVHFGARGSNRVVEMWQRRFYEELFFPYLEEHGIKTIIQTGDYFDNRKSIDLTSLAFQRDVFIKPTQEMGIGVYGIVGNHDMPYKNSLRNNSVDQILNPEPNFEFVQKPKKFDFDGVEITLMPWVCKENFEECQEVLQTGGDIVIGHFEISGFVMHPGAVSRDGLKMSDFKNWNKVLSGHYHTQSENGNIQYIGTPYQMSWNDFSTRHGFWVFDTTDRNLEFIENPFRYFHRFVWEDGCSANMDFIKDSFVKVSIRKKTDFESFEKFIDKINFNSPYDLRIIESFEEFNSDNVKELIKVSTTEELIAEYVSEVGTENNKEQIKTILLDIFEAANQIEE